MTFTQLLALVKSSGRRVTADSRSVQKGDVFVAIHGTQADGHDFVKKALDRGASYFVTERPVDGCTCIIVENSARAMGLLAQASYDYPNAKLTNLAVTGTNGKTTVAYMVRSIIGHIGAKCGLIGTVEYDTGGKAVPAPLTTPDPATIARAAAEMVQNECSYMVIEASSHALDQQRLAGISFTAAAFTNLTGDHLDYHKTFEEYLRAKTRLFLELPSHGLAVLNDESQAAHTMAEIIKPGPRVLWYAIDRDVDISAEIERMDASGSDFSIIFNNYREHVTLRLPGRHNILNALAAAGLCLSAGLALSDIVLGLSALQAVPGRLQPVRSQAAKQRGIDVYIDYAHTDDALKNVLITLKPLCKGRLIVLFGCGGDRDKTKRPRMSKVAEEYADIIVVTSDNPRTEDPQMIIDDILPGFSDLKAVHVEPDRAKAIRLVIDQAQQQDMILIAGKGHEDYQIIGTEKRHFSDLEEAQKALES